MKRVLLTAFDPFGGSDTNSAMETMQMVESAEVILYKQLIPTSFGISSEVLREAIRKYDPDTVICLGQAEGRKWISLERVAINVMDARIPDNSGYQPQDVTIRPEGENAYFTHIDIRKLLKLLEEENIPVRISDTAGTFVCNYLMYQLLYIIEKEKGGFRGGFIHLPVEKDMPLETMTRAVKIIIENA